MDGSSASIWGVKNSGFGRELSELGFGEFVNEKLINVAPPCSPHCRPKADPSAWKPAPVPVRTEALIAAEWPSISAASRHWYYLVYDENARILAPDRRQVNFLATQKRKQSRKLNKMYDIIESRSPGPYLELFARGTRPKWSVWAYKANANYPNGTLALEHTYERL